MTAIFLQVVNMSISASWIVLAVLLLRLLLKKAPKWVAVLLWGIVAVRLICPFAIESALSLIPSAETISPEIMTDATPAIDTGIPVINDAINTIFSEASAPIFGDSVNPLQIWIPILTAVWVIGMVVLFIYTAVSYWRIRRRICTAVLHCDNIYQSEAVISPFVLGIIKPKIYLPFQMRQQDMEHVIAHEQAHISRKDHLWKPMGFLLLTLHWFNPLMWLGYVLLCRDIELACDEKVVKKLTADQRADYSEALLACSVNRRLIAACPLSFGEVCVQDRVQTVLYYEQPAVYLVAAAILVSVAVAVCFLTDPPTEILDDILKGTSVTGRKTYNIGEFVDLNTTNALTSMPLVWEYTDRLDDSFKIHRSALGEREQQLYDILLPYVLSYTPFSMGRNDMRCTYDELQNATNAIRMDYPETGLYFSSGGDFDASTLQYYANSRCYSSYCSAYYSLYWTKPCVEYFNRIQVEEHISKIDAACDSILKKMPKGLSKEEKYAWIADYLCDTVEYSNDYYAGGYRYGNLDGPILYGKGTCQAYATAYQYLCQKAGLWCTVYNGGLSEVWYWCNAVKLEDGTIAYMGVLQADNTQNFDRYYFMTKEEFINIR